VAGEPMVVVRALRRCQNGEHAMTRANTYVSPLGRRYCRRCMCARKQRWRKKRA
jgi:hypothetical protein